MQGFCCGELYATYSHIQNLETDTEVQSRFTPDFEVMRDIRVSMATSMTCFDNRTDEIAIGDEGDDFHDTTASQNSDEIVLEPCVASAGTTRHETTTTGTFLALDKCLPCRQFIEAGIFSSLLVVCEQY